MRCGERQDDQYPFSNRRSPIGTHEIYHCFVSCVLMDRVAEAAFSEVKPASVFWAAVLQSTFQITADIALAPA
jgi:hypothetical protein